MSFSDADWHVARDGQQFGPVTRQQLEEAYRNGTVLPTDYVWSPDLTDWMAAADIFEAKRAEPAPAKQVAADPRRSPGGDTARNDRIAATSSPAAMPSRAAMPAPAVVLPDEMAEGSYKISTYVYIALAIIVPVWPVTTPLFLYLAYLSYRKPPSGPAR